MTVEELLKPRYKVIDDWPGMKDMAVGQIITMNGRWPNPDSTLYWKWSITDCQGTREYTTMYFEKWPHLFKRLNWWEEREPEEMPAYVKETEYGSIVNVYKVKEHYTHGGACCLCDGNINYVYLQPATEAEYITSKQTNP